MLPFAPRKNASFAERKADARAQVRKFAPRGAAQVQRSLIVNQTEMLHQMCQSVLSEADIKAICKNRGLPGDAVSSRSLLESLFMSETGMAATLAALDRTEIALLHLLKAVGKPVDVAFFSR